MINLLTKTLTIEQMLSRIIHIDGVVDSAVAFVFLHALVLGAIVVDLVSGYRKAKRLGEDRTSKALRRTVNKINSYYSCLLLMSMIDVTLFIINVWDRVGIPELPYFAGVSTIMLIVIELKSVVENRSINDPKIPDDEEVIMLDKIKEGSEALDEIIKWATAKKSKLEELKGKEGES